MPVFRPHLSSDTTAPKNGAVFPSGIWPQNSSRFAHRFHRRRGSKHCKQFKNRTKKSAQKSAWKIGPCSTTLPPSPPHHPPRPVPHPAGRAGSGRTGMLRRQLHREDARPTFVGAHGGRRVRKANEDKAGGAQGVRQARQDKVEATRERY